MPFITQEARDRVHTTNLATTGGELSFLFLFHARRYIATRGPSLCYDDFADVVAALEGTKFVFQDEDLRRYEATKRHENGDV